MMIEVVERFKVPSVYPQRFFLSAKGSFNERHKKKPLTPKNEGLPRSKREA